MPNYNSSHTGSEIDGAVTKVNASGVTQTELSYLDGLSSNIQTQLGLKAALNDNTQNIIANNITVHGTLTTKDSQNVNIGDAIITLNAEETGTPSENAGFEIERGTSTNTVLRWNESSDRWEFTNDGSTFYNIPISTEYNNYTLPTASSSTLGGIKVGTNLSIDGSGVLSASGGFTSFTIADTDSTQAIGDGIHIKFAASNSGSYGNSQISGSGTSGSPYLVSLNVPDSDRYVNAASFNTSDGVLTLTRAGSDSATVTVDLDGRFLTGITGQSIDSLNNVNSISSITNGQFLVWNSTANAFQPGSGASYSWYLRDGDTTAVQITDAKYVKFVEGNNLIDINFTDTDSGEVDDEFDLTFTVNSSNITSVGTLTSLNVSGVTGIGTTSPSSATNVLLSVGDTSLGYAGMEFIAGTNAERWRLYTSFDGSSNAIFGLFRVADSTYKLQVDESGNTIITGTVTWSGGSSTNANTAYSWGDHGDAGYLTAITGQSIKNLLDVASNSPSNGQILQWNSTGNYYEPVTFTSSYSWYLRDGDTTAVEITSGKYVKLVEGTGIDINFTDTSSGAVDDEYDVTITNTLMTSGGTISGAVTFDASPVFSTGATGTLANRDGFTDFIGYNATYGSYIGGGASNASRYIYAGGYFYDGSSVRTLIHSGNIGSQTVATATNADTLDSYHGSNYIGKNGNTYYRPNTWINFADSGGAGLYWSSGTGSGWHLYPVDSNDFYIRSGNSAQVGLAMSTAGTTRGYVYANSSNNIGLLNQAGSWALKKVSGGSMFLYDDGGQTQLGSGDEWGRLQSEGYTNGFYIYSGSTYRVDGAHFATYDNGELDLGTSSYRWRQLFLADQIIGGFGATTTGGTTNWNDSSNARSGAGYTLLLGNASNGPSGTSNYFHPFSFEYSSKDGSGNMCQFAIPYIVGAGGGMYMRSRYSGGWGGWVNFHDTDNMSGVARTSNTYGSFNITNGNGSYPGHTYTAHSNKPTVMFADSTSSGGIYYQGTGRWAVYHNYGHNCLGVDTSSTEAAYELKVNGDILATGDVVAFSDARWKTEIETISNPIDKIMDMRGVYYKELPKGDKKVSDRRKMGVIAQEMLKVAPEVVTYGETNDEYAVDYSKLVGILIEGIKELKQEINELKGS